MLDLTGLQAGIIHGMGKLLSQAQWIAKVAWAPALVCEDGHLEKTCDHDDEAKTNRSSRVVEGCEAVGGFVQVEESFTINDVGQVKAMLHHETHTSHHGHTPMLDFCGTILWEFGGVSLCGRGEAEWIPHLCFLSAKGEGGTHLLRPRCGEGTSASVGARVGH